MERDYLLIPRGDGACFDSDALSQMRAYWNGKPFYVRGDGAYVICLDEETRKILLRSYDVDKPNYSSQVILFQPNRVVLGSLGWIELDAEFADFVEWCQQRWPCALFRDTGEPAQASQLRHD